MPAPRLRRLSYAAAIAWLFLANAPAVLGATIPEPGNAVPFPQGGDYNVRINEILDRVFTLLYAVFGALAVLGLVYAGIQYMSAGRSMDRAKLARQRIIGTVIAIALLTAAFAVIRLIISLVYYLP